MNTKHLLIQTTIQLSELKNFNNKEIKRIINNFLTQELNIKRILTTFKDLICIKKYNNNEISDILKLLDSFIKNILDECLNEDLECEIKNDKNEVSNNVVNLDEKNGDMSIKSRIIDITKLILNLQFSRFDKEVEGTLIVFFELLNTLSCLSFLPFNIQEEIFLKFYFALIEKVAKKTFLKEIYKNFIVFLRGNLNFIPFFIEKRLYVDFPFIKDFLKEFYRNINDEIVEISLYLFESKDYSSLSTICLLKEPNLYLFQMFYHALSNLPIFDSFWRIRNLLPFIYIAFDCNPFLKNLSLSHFDILLKKYDCIFLNEIINNLEYKEIKECSFCEDVKKILQKNRRKQELLDYIEKFNSSPFVGDIFCTPLECFYYLRLNEHTNLNVLGDFISKKKNLNYLKIFLDTFNFKDKDLLESLREFLLCFLLPGESQVITRVIGEFANKYYDDNYKHPSEIEHDNVENAIENNIENCAESVNLDDKEILKKSIYIITYSLIVLNTNLHNANIKQKTNLPAFIEANRKCNISKEFTDEYLTSVYNSIKKTQIKFPFKNTTTGSSFKIFEFLNKGEMPYKNTVLYFIPENICCGCSKILYSKIFLMNYHKIIKVKNESLIEPFVKISKILELEEPLNYFLNFLFSEINFNSQNESEQIERFFKYFFVYIEMGMENERVDPDPLILPVTIFKNLFMFQEQQNASTSFLKKALSLESAPYISKEYERTYQNFLRTTSTLNTQLFKRLIVATINLTEKNEILSKFLFAVLDKNCFRINEVIEEVIVFIKNSNGKNDLKIFNLLEKIVELGLVNEFCRFSEIYNENQAFLFFLNKKVLRENLVFVDENVLECMKNVIGKDENVISFENILLLQRKYDLFDFLVKIEFQKETFKEGEYFKIHYEERFSSILNQQKSLMEFLISSPSIINNKEVEKYFMRKKNEIEDIKCPLEESLFDEKVMDKKLIYLLLKTDLLKYKELTRYTLWIVNLISSSIPLLVGFFKRNIFIFLNVENEYLKISIIKILISRIYKSKQGEVVCCGSKCEHINIWKDVEECVSWLIANNIIDRSAIDFDIETNESTNTVYEI